MAEQKLTSIEIGRAALRIAVTENRTEEQRIKEQLAAKGIRSTAVDFGGEFMPSVVKNCGARRCCGAASGHCYGNPCWRGRCCRSCPRCFGAACDEGGRLNVGGKIGIARSGEHLCVAIYMAVGVLNLDELCVALGHRSLASEE